MSHENWRQYYAAITARKVGEVIDVGYEGSVEHGQIIQTGGDDGPWYVVNNTFVGTADNPLNIIGVNAFPVENRMLFPTLGNQILLPPHTLAKIIGYWALDTDYPKKWLTQQP